MSDILPFLKSLISVSGLSAYEGPVARLIEEKWKLLVDEISLSRLGSLHALKHGAYPSGTMSTKLSAGNGPSTGLRRERSGERTGRGKRPSIMIAAHMDAIGLMVTKIVEGFLHVDDVGGVDARILPGTPVVVHGRQDLPGVVVLPPLKTLPEKSRDDAIDLPHLLVDVGLPPSRVANLVRVGDLVSFDTQPVELAGEALSGHSLDNRASVAALTVCLEELQSKSHTWDVWAVATAQEEETLGGAATSAFDLHPDLAIAIDVTFAKSPGADGWETFPLGRGPALGWGANLHPFLYKKFKELAEKLEIPVAMDVVPAHSGTDAHAIQVAREGIPTMLLGIPLRYMHTPVEVIAVKDLQRVGRLLAEFISGLEPDFLSQIVWDEAQDEEKKA
jgi:endoglucanase